MGTRILPQDLGGRRAPDQEGLPKVFHGYEAMGSAAHAGGPLDAKTRELVKLGMCIGARLEGATHSHTQKALAAGATAKEIRHAAVLAITTQMFEHLCSQHGFTWEDFPVLVNWEENINMYILHNDDILLKKDYGRKQLADGDKLSFHIQGGCC
jgi:4-carboxymuconolactone decarboxylase